MEVFIRSTRYRGPVQAVVLDWAGTGIDHGCFGPVQPIVQAFAEHGIELYLPEARGPMGLAKKDHIRAVLYSPRIFECWREVYGKHPQEADVEDIYILAERLMLSSVKNYATPVAGAVESLKKFRNIGLKIGSTTGYTALMMETVKKQAEEHGYFVDCLCTAEDTGDKSGRGRPYPFMMYQNAIKMGVYPMEAMVKIGDTPVDIAEGLNSGAWTIGITHSSSQLGLSEQELAGLGQAERERLVSGAEGLLKNAGAHFVVPYLQNCVQVIQTINQQLSLGRLPVPAE